MNLFTKFNLKRLLKRGFIIIAPAVSLIACNGGNMGNTSGSAADAPQTNNTPLAADTSTDPIPCPDSSSAIYATFTNHQYQYTGSNLKNVTITFEGDGTSQLCDSADCSDSKAILIPANGYTLVNYCKMLSSIGYTYTDGHLTMPTSPSQFNVDVEDRGQTGGGVDDANLQIYGGPYFTVESDTSGKNGVVEVVGIGDDGNGSTDGDLQIHDTDPVYITHYINNTTDVPLANVTTANTTGDLLFETGPTGVGSACTDNMNNCYGNSSHLTAASYQNNMMNYTGYEAVIGEDQPTGDFYIEGTISPEFRQPAGNILKAGSFQIEIASDKHVTLAGNQISTFAYDPANKAGYRAAIKITPNDPTPGDIAVDLNENGITSYNKQIINYTDVTPQIDYNAYFNAGINPSAQYIPGACPTPQNPVFNLCPYQGVDAPVGTNLLPVTPAAPGSNTVTNIAYILQNNKLTGALQIPVYNFDGSYDGASNGPILGANGTTKYKQQTLTNQNGIQETITYVVNCPTNGDLTIYNGAQTSCLNN